MVKNLFWSTLCMIGFFAIGLSDRTHWGWNIIQFIFLTIHWLSLDDALDKEKKLLKRIEELENIHKEQE